MKHTTDFKDDIKAQAALNFMLTLFRPEDHIKVTQACQITWNYGVAKGYQSSSQTLESKKES